MPKLPLKPAMPVRTAAPSATRPVIVNVRTGRFALCTATQGDATPDLAAWMSDPVVIQGLNGTGQAMSVDQLRAYISGFDNSRKNLAIIKTAAEGSPIGLVMFDVEPRHRIGTFHILIGDRKHRVGEASYTAVRLVLRHLFDVRGVEKACIEPLSRNRAVVQYCQWLGLRQEGVLLAHRKDSRSGARLDQHVFGMTKDEYQSWPHRLR